MLTPVYTCKPATKLISLNQNEVRGKIRGKMARKITGKMGGKRVGKMAVLSSLPLPTPIEANKKVEHE